MPFPAARVGDITATGDADTGTGVPTVLIGGKPVSVLGDIVTGSVCIGAVTMGNPTILVGGRPIARLTSQCAGVNPITGMPVSTVIATPCCPTVLV
jgi:uncharacterized Zn-binding protein involved in type VI secretion